MSRSNPNRPSEGANLLNWNSNDNSLDPKQVAAQKKEEYRRVIQQQMAEREQRKEEEKRNRLLKDKQDEDKIKEQQKQLYSEYLRESGKPAQQEPVKVEKPKTPPPQEASENRQPPPAAQFPRSPAPQFTPMQPQANFQPRTMRPTYPQPNAFPDRSEMNKLRTEMKQQYDNLNHLIKDMKNESHLASQQRADAQMELERIKQELNMSVYENQLRNQELMMMMQQQRFQQMQMPQPGQGYTMPVQGYQQYPPQAPPQQYGNLSSSLPQQYQAQPTFATQQYQASPQFTTSKVDPNTNTAETHLSGQSQFVPVDQDTFDMAQHGEVNPTYSYIDNPDIKAELSKLDYLLNVHLKVEGQSGQTFNDTINDRDPGELVYHDDRSQEFDAQTSWQTFERPESAQDEDINDIKLKTVTEMQEFDEGTEEEEEEYNQEEIDEQQEEYDEEEVSEDIHRDVEDEF